MASKKINSEVLSLFPYDSIRPIQDDLIETIHEALKKRKNIIIEGANGLGKTVATLSAALPIALEKELQIVHVCRTNKQAERVISELKVIAQKKSVSGLVMRGRREMCTHDLVQSHANDSATASLLCSQLKKQHKCELHNRMNERLPHLKKALKDLQAQPVSSTDIKEICDAHRLCPYEVSLQLLETVNVVAASYQYLFNPRIRDIFINKANKAMNELLLIVDECHNIVDTALDISSNQLSLYSVRQAQKEIRAFNNHQYVRLARFLEKYLTNKQKTSSTEEKIDIKKMLRSLSKELGEVVDLDYAEKIISAGMQNQYEYLSRNKPPRSFLHSLGQFIFKAVITKNRSEFLHLVTTYKTRGGQWTNRFEIVSLDARYTTKHVLEYVRNSIHMSGTISPIDAYAQIVGMDTLPLVTKVLPSPYTEQNIQAYIIQGLTTKLRDRTSENYKKMGQIIGEAVTYAPANVGIFTASYSVMNGLLDTGLEYQISKPLFYEKGQMTSTANDRLVNKFKEYASKGGAVLLGVLGGRSSEGADFPGEEMNVCIIVGIPYAPPTTRIQSQIEYLDEQFPRKGREYGYIIPAIRRAAQAAGRPIRSIQDKGLIIFLDERFGYSYTVKFLPQWIRQNTRQLPYVEGTIRKITEDFFESK